MKKLLLAILMLTVLLLLMTPTVFADDLKDPVHADTAGNGVTPQLMTSTVGSVEEVDPSTITYTNCADFEDVAGGAAPGTNYDEILTSGGIEFAERFAGQVLEYVTVGSYVFDKLSGSPTSPLSLQVGLSKQNSCVYTKANYGQVLAGVGPLGYPAYDAIAEGAIAALFPNPQTGFTIDIAGVDGGGVVTLDFFKQDGTLLGTIAISPSNQTYGFVTTSGLPEIAGISIYNTDPAGVVYDNLCYTLIQIRFPVDNPTDGVSWHHYPGSYGHAPSSGISAADDTYALDLNWKSGAADLGKPVYAIQDGVIEQVNKTWGWVLIKHNTLLEWRGQTYYTWYSGYAHMRNISKNVTPGANIGISTQIGEVAGVGKGKDFFPHLHFAIYVGRTQKKAPVNAFLESVDPGQVAGPEYAAYTYGDLETTYDWGLGAIYNHNVDESTGQDANHWFERGGSESDWFGTGSYGFHDYMFYTHTEKSNTDNWGRWNHILLADGEFTVMAFVPRNYGTSRLATYTVSINGTFIFSETLSQKRYYDKWVTLGNVNGKAGDRLDIYLVDNTGEKSKYLAYDAIKIWMKQDLALPRS